MNWHWLTQLKSNRLVDPDGSGNRAVREVLVAMTGSIVHLRGYGWIKVFKIAAPDGSIEYWATDDLTMTIEQLAHQAEKCWRIEAYHRGIKQFCGEERSQHRSATAQRNHIGLSL